MSVTRERVKRGSLDQSQVTSPEERLWHPCSRYSCYTETKEPSKLPEKQLPDSPEIQKSFGAAAKCCFHFDENRFFKLSLENCAKDHDFLRKSHERPAEEIRCKANAGLVIFWRGYLWVVASLHFLPESAELKTSCRRDTFSCHILQTHKCLFGRQLQSARICSFNQWREARRREWGGSQSAGDPLLRSQGQ